ncbi:hypothetical protein [Ralstonia pickettii]|uniref:hypothetical protein n=1 Tax=Ralstonia pickettii TaxID=329 RepID=UPI0021759057|nr:hypothetical protein [Ralstonia pickettii]
MTAHLAPAAWPFPSERKRAEMRALDSISEHAQITEPQWNSLAATGTPPAESAVDGEVQRVLERRRKTNSSGQSGEDAHHIRQALAAQKEAVPAQPALTPANINILALDLATQSGWAVMTRDGTFRSGSVRFDSNRLGGKGHRWLAFRKWLMDTATECGGIQAVYYEDVKQPFASNLAARAYCGFLAIVEAWAAINNIPLHGVGVGTVKKAWTGKGNASKSEMVAAARQRGIKVVDDNEADAVAILSLALQQEA